MPEQSVKRVNLESPGIVDAIQDTKQAAVFATLGLPFKSPGVFITYDEDNPKSSGGVANFLFASTEQNDVKRVMRVWSEATADIELDSFLDDLEKNFPGCSRKFTDAVIVYCRRALENYRALIHFIKTGAPEFVITGGEAVYDEQGNVFGKQGFTIKKVAKK